MALLWVEGFESFGTTVGNAPAPTGVLASKYGTVVSESSIDVETGRAGDGRSLQLAVANTRFHTPNLSTTNRTLITGFAFKGGYTATFHSAYVSSMFKDTTWDMGLFINGTGTMSVRDNTGADMGVCDFTFKTGKWYWVEWKVYTDNSAGTVEVRVGGVPVLELSGIDTQFTAFNYKNAVNFKDNTGAGCYIDDWYVCDGSGSDNNDFLGNGKVETLRPDGTSTSGWVTSSPSATHSDNVDEAESDDNTSYVQELTSTNKDLYTYDDTSDIQDVKGLQLNTRARTNSGVSETINAVVSSNSTESNTAHAFSSTSFFVYTVVSEQDPYASSAWTTTTVDAALFGYEYV